MKSPFQKAGFRTLARGLGRTLFISLLFFSLVPLIATSWINSQNSQHSLYKKETNSLKAALQLRCLYLTRYFNNQADYLQLLAENNNTVDFLSNLTTSFKNYHQPLNQFISSYEHIRLVVKYGGDPQHFLQISKIHDLLLIDKEGNILYSVATESDLGTNIINGPYKDTALARVFRKVMQARKPLFSDVSYYKPSNNQEAIFGGNTVFDEHGKIIGVLIVQFNLSPIYTIMSDTTGLGDTGQIFLVGTDGTLRSKLRSDPRQKILHHRIDNPLIESWLTRENRRNRETPWAENDEGAATFLSSTYTGADGKTTLGIVKNITTLDKFSIHLLMVAEIDTSEAYRAANEQKRNSLVILFITVGLVILLAMFLTRRLTTPLGHLTEWAKQVAGGDLTIKNIETQDNEIGILYKNLTIMVASLQKMRREHNEQDWLKTGNAKVNTALQNTQDITSLARATLSCLASYLDLQVGAFFILRDDILHFTAGYAYTTKERFLQFKLGEGLIGQSALEQKTIVVKDLPDDNLDMEICSAFGASKPRSIVVIPLLHDNEIRGVMEFGTHHNISNREVSFLETVAKSIAVVTHAALAREKLRLLLERSQAQSEELASQQEELRQANNILEQQAITLRASEATLQAQQEELRQTNEELEEQTKFLEQQNIILEKTRREVAASSRYKSEFLANMSHELRTPLNSILLLSQYLATNKNKNMTEKQVECAQTVHSSGTELLNLINEILDLAKIESGKITIQPTECRMEDITATMIRHFQPIADKKKIVYNVLLSDNMPKSIQTDCQRLSQIVKNLLSNAFKFTEKGEISLTISMTNGLLPVTFTVKDSGIGIKQEKIASIFDAFQQEDGSTSRKYGGTGLGLSISKQLAALLGGTLEAASTVGRGSTFTLSLPKKLGLPEETSSLATTSPSPGSARDGHDPKNIIPASCAGTQKYIPDDRKNIAPKSRTILIIEDDMNFAKILRDTAREKGFMALVAESGETGLQLTELYKPDGIILDMDLPGMDGNATLLRLKDNLISRHIPVHVLSATDKTIEPMHMGAVGFLTKPVSMESLDTVFTRIERVISRKVKKILIVEGDEDMRREVTSLIGDDVVETTTVTTGKEAKDALIHNRFDCIIIDLLLPDMNCFQLLQDLKNREDFFTPVIIHADRELTISENHILNRLADSIVVKNVKSMDKLLDESSLFIHRLATDLPADKKEIIRKLHDREAILAGKTILIVDDDMRNVFSLVNILEEKGMQTIIAENGVIALEKLQKHPEIDLVLMDIMMPEMDGYKAMKIIREMDFHHSHIAIIALTAKAMKGDRARCIQAGASDYLSKPVDTDKLFSMLRVWLY